MIGGSVYSMKLKVEIFPRVTCLYSTLHSSFPQVRELLVIYSIYYIKSLLKGNSFKMSLRVHCLTRFPNAYLFAFSMNCRGCLSCSISISQHVR